MIINLVVIDIIKIRKGVKKMIHSINFFVKVSAFDLDLRLFQPIDYVRSYYKYSDNINFKFKLPCNLNIETTVEAIINKKYEPITVKDYELYMSKLKEIVNKVVKIDIDDLNLMLTRIDYKVDIPMSSQEIKLMENLKDKYSKKYKYMKQKQEYETSVHLSNKYGQYNINSYSKFDESKNNKYLNRWRIEVQTKKTKMRKNFLNYGIKKELKNYWCKSSFHENFFEVLKGYYYLGDYYTLNKARELIRKSSYSKTIQNNLCKFITSISRYGIDYARNKYNYSVFNKYISILNEIKVNPVTIDNDSELTYMENILKRAERIANEKYFN